MFRCGVSIPRNSREGGGWEDRFGAALEKILLGLVGLSLIYLFYTKEWV